MLNQGHPYSQLFKPQPDGGQSPDGRLSAGQAPDMPVPEIPALSPEDVGHQPPQDGFVALPPGETTERQGLLEGLGRGLAELAARRIIEAPEAEPVEPGAEEDRVALPPVIHDFFRDYVRAASAGRTINEEGDSQGPKYFGMVASCLHEAVDAIYHRKHGASFPNNKTISVWELLEFDNPKVFGAVGGLMKDRLIRSADKASKADEYGRDAAMAEVDAAERLMVGMAMIYPFMLDRTAYGLHTGEGTAQYRHGQSMLLALRAFASKYEDISSLRDTGRNIRKDSIYDAYRGGAGVIIDRMVKLGEDTDYRREWMEAVAQIFANLEEQDPEPLETEWVILPVGSDDQERTVNGSEPANGSQESFVDTDRIKKLHALVKDWGSGRVMKGKLKGSGRSHSYYVAVLPQEVDGQIIEHVVADCEEGPNNAIYAYRADKSGNTHPWQFVFDGNKTRASAFGAKVIKHTKYVDDNVMEYLTRPPERLDDAQYRR